MNAIFKIFLSISISGGLLTLVLLLAKCFLKDRLSRQWQYYIWIAVVLRLLIPLGPKMNLPLLQQQSPLSITETSPALTTDLEPNSESAKNPTEALTTAPSFQNIAAVLTEHVWLLWLVIALILFIRKITVYQGYMRYIHAGATPVSDTEILDALSKMAEQCGCKRPIDLCVNPLISSPLLIGFFHPCIVLPNADIPEKNFRYIALHELTHYRRRDIFYKWLVQTAVCLHWFNPFVYLMSREIAKACEFSCDEAILAKTGWDSAPDYGKTLLDAMAAVGKYKGNPGAVTLSENKQLLRERLGAIMNYRKKSIAIRILTAALTLLVMLGAAFTGVRPIAAAKQPSGSKNYVKQAERYYEADSLPLFEIAFSHLNKREQKNWLKKLYGNDDLVYFSAALRGLDTSSSLFASYAKKAYADGEIAFFSILTDYMDKAELERWLDRALEDENWSFQSMLFDKLDRDEEFDELEDMRDDDDESDNHGQQAAGGRIWHPQVIPVHAETMADKEILWLGEYSLSDGDRIWYQVSAETGNGLQVGFARPGDTRLNTTYYSVKNLRQKGEALECTASFTVKPPVKDGTYRLFVRAADGALENVKGSISIGFTAEASADRTATAYQ